MPFTHNGELYAPSGDQVIMGVHIQSYSRTPSPNTGKSEGVPKTSPSPIAHIVNMLPQVACADIESGDTITFIVEGNVNVFVLKLTVDRKVGTTLFTAEGGRVKGGNRDIYLVSPSLQKHPGVTSPTDSEVMTDMGEEDTIEFSDIHQGDYIMMTWSAGDVAVSAEGYAHRKSDNEWLTRSGVPVAMRGENMMRKDSPPGHPTPKVWRTCPPQEVVPGDIVAVRHQAVDAVITRIGQVQRVEISTIFSREGETLFTPWGDNQCYVLRR